MRRPLAALALVVLVALLDTVTKLVLSTPDWGWHAVSPPDPLLPLLVVTAGLLIPLIRWPLALALGGAWSNALWTRTEAVPNPFVANPDDGFGIRDLYSLTGAGEVAYNLADVCITIGVYGLVVCFVVYSVKLWRRALRRRRALRARPVAGVLG